MARESVRRGSGVSVARTATKEPGGPSRVLRLRQGRVFRPRRSTCEVSVVYLVGEGVDFGAG
jgi:hypothetical protein